MDPVEALRKLAAASNLQMVRVGKHAYVLEARSTAPKPASTAARTATSPSVPKQAPAAAEEQIEPIIITASKRDVIAARFGGQWTKIDGKSLTGIGPVGTEEIGTRTVGLSSTHLGAGRNKLFIRGIADSSFSGPTQSPVGQYVGDMRTGYSGPDPDLRLIDIGKVEILEGPQGTLYGSGAVGGIVRLTPNPAEFGEFSASLASGISSTRHGDIGFDGAATVNLPFGDGATLRLVGYHGTEGGYIDLADDSRRNINELRVNGLRGQFAVQAAANWTIEFNGIGQNIRADDAQYADVGGDDLTRTGTTPLPNASGYRMANVVVRNDGGAIRLVSTSGGIWQDVDERFDAGMSGEDRVLLQQSRGRSISSETRIFRPMRNGYGWLFGFSVLSHELTIRRSLESDTAKRDLAGTRNRVEEWTVYGEGSAELTEWLDATIGTRFTRARLEGTGEHVDPIFVIASGIGDHDRTETRVLPSASLVARPVHGLSAYLRYQQGFRPGGLSVNGDQVRLFRNDLVKTTEIGFHANDLVPAITVSGSVSHSRWTDIQADYLDLGGLPVTDNIGDGRVWSASLTGTATIATGLKLEGGWAWNDGRITQPNTLALAFATLRSTDVMAIPNIARSIARSALDWDHHLSNGAAFHANLYVRYVGTSRLGIGPRLGEKQGDYFDTGLSLRYSRGAFGWTLTADNLLDATGNRFAFGGLYQDVEAITPLRPRTIRLGIDWAL